MPAIYHFTDVDNLPGILEAGELRCHRVAPTEVDVADSSIKGRRMTKAVPCGQGGVVGDYVPFYFATRSPMLYRIKCGGVEGVSPDQRRIAYLVSSTEAIIGAGIAFVFTDGNAAAAFTTFHDDESLLDEVVDWPLMEATMWANTPTDPDRRRRRCAEFLVYGSVPLDLVSEIGVFNPGAERRVSAAVDRAGHDVTVRVRQNWYF